MELTQEQIDAMVAEKIAEAKKGLFTEEDLQKKVVAEVDRRVETGIKKGLETNRKKWEEEFQAKAQMTAEELAQKEINEKLQTVTQKEKEIQKRANALEAKELLSEAKVPKAHYDKFINMLVTEDSETTKNNINNFISMFNDTKTGIETEVKSQLSSIPKPKIGTNNGVMTKEAFNKLSYSEMIAFKTSNPEQFKEFLK